MAGGAGVAQATTTSWRSSGQDTIACVVPEAGNRAPLLQEGYSRRVRRCDTARLRVFPVADPARCLSPAVRGPDRRQRAAYTRDGCWPVLARVRSAVAQPATGRHFA